MIDLKLGIIAVSNWRRCFVVVEIIVFRIDLALDFFLFLLVLVVSLLALLIST